MMTANRLKPTTDRAEIVRALNLTIPAGEVFEVRALEATTAGDRFSQTHSGYFSDVEAAADAVMTIKSAQGIYFIPNKLPADLLSRASNRIRAAKKQPLTSDHDVLGYRYLLVDFDPSRAAGISSSDAEHDAALDMAQGVAETMRELHGWPMPMAGDSGNGAHLMYLVDLPADAGPLVARVLAALAKQFDTNAVKVDQTTHNPARIWKLYGTLACKGDSTDDRPHRVSRMVSAPHMLETLTREQLEEYCGPAPVEAPKNGHANGHHHRNGNGKAIDLKEFLDRHHIGYTGPEDWRSQQGIAKRYMLTACVWNPAHTDNSAWVAQFPSGALAAGCSHNGCKGKDWTNFRANFESKPQNGLRHDTNSKNNGKTVYVSAVGAPDKVEKEPAPEFKPFPTECLPVPVSDYIRNAAETIGCDESYIALPLLASLAQAIGAYRRIRLKYGWNEPSILWTIIIGDSGSLKSPAIELGTQFTRKIQQKLYTKYAAEMSEYKEALSKWKATPKDARGEEPGEPEQCLRLMIADTTMEAACERMQLNPRGLLLCRDEQAGWFGSFNQYKSGAGGDVANWLEVFGGRSITVDRKTGTQKTTYIPRASISITGGIQPGTLSRVLQPEFFENGLVPRLFFAMPPRRAKKWTEAEVDPAIESRMMSLFAILLNQTGKTDVDGSTCPIDIPLAHHAKTAWISFVNSNGVDQFERSDERSIAAWSKLEGGAARLALIIHQIRVATGDTTADPERIGYEDIENGITLAKWFGYEAERVYGILRESDEDREDRLLCEYIQKQGGTITVRQLCRGNRKYSTAEAAEQRLQELVDADRGVWVIPPHTNHRGQQVQRYFSLRADADTNTNSPQKTAYVSGDNPESEAM